MTSQEWNEYGKMCNYFNDNFDILVETSGQQVSIVTFEEDSTSYSTKTYKTGTLLENMKSAYLENKYETQFVNTELDIDEEILHALQDIAYDEDITIDEYINEILSDYLKFNPESYR